MSSNSNTPTTNTTKSQDENLANLPPRKKLPSKLQETLDSEEKMWEVLVEGEAEDSTESNVRYAAYASRLRTIMMSAHRYVAYTSDIGESFRPVAHPNWVRAAYGVSWLYLAGDVAHEGYKAYIHNQQALHPGYHIDHTNSPSTEAQERKGRDIVVSKAGSRKENLTEKGLEAANKMAEGLGLAGGSGNPVTGSANASVVPRQVSALEDYRTVMAQRAVFQGLASMGLPAFTIHSVVRYSGRAMKNVKNARLRTWGPIGLGLSVVPFLPYIFDEPVEHATEWVFYNAFKAIGGEKAVAGRSPTGNHHRPGDKVPEKEL